MIVNYLFEKMLIPAMLIDGLPPLSEIGQPVRASGLEIEVDRLAVMSVCKPVKSFLIDLVGNEMDRAIAKK
jgi:hypothetical protein